MKKLQNMTEGSFLKLLFGFLTLCFLIAAFCMPDRAQMVHTLGQILTNPSKISANYFYFGYAGTFLNVALVGAACLALFVVFKATPNNVSTLAYILTLGFCTWGINILNMWFSILGVVLYGLVKKEKLGSLVNAMLFSTGIAPLITDLLIRYPNATVVGFNPLGFGLALLVGVIIGFFLPAGLAHSPKVHKGFDLYSAALPVGMTAFFLNATLYKTLGVSLPDALSDMKELGVMSVQSQLTTNVLLGSIFVICIVVAFLMGCRPKDYWKLLTDPELVTNFSSTYGNATFLMNMGVYGLFILGYYNLIDAPFNGITFGIVLCMLACCNSGSHPGNVWPIMLGYVVASLVCGWISPLLGGKFIYTINAQAICVGLCYANGLSPIADKYGWRYGFVAAVMHYLLVTSVPSLHGGFCLYNGGFTAALICLILVPELEKFATTVKERQERRLLKKAK